MTEVPSLPIVAFICKSIPSVIKLFSLSDPASASVIPWRRFTTDGSALPPELLEDTKNGVQWCSSQGDSLKPLPPTGAGTHGRMALQCRAVYGKRQLCHLS